jgi:hypothetical protein
MPEPLLSLASGLAFLRAPEFIIVNWHEALHLPGLSPARQRFWIVFGRSLRRIRGVTSILLLPVVILLVWTTVGSAHGPEEVTAVP